jgi:hypothetical protein
MKEIEELYSQVLELLQGIRQTGMAKIIRKFLWTLFANTPNASHI